MKDQTDSMDWTHEMCLEAAKKVITDDRPDGMMIVYLWTEGGQFSTRFMNVGLKCSEMVALLEVQKQRIMELMKTDKKERGGSVYDDV